MMRTLLSTIHIVTLIGKRDWTQIVKGIIFKISSKAKKSKLRKERKNQLVEKVTND